VTRGFLALLAALFAGGVAASPVRALLPAYVESVLHQPPAFTATLLAIQLGCGGIFALAGGALSDLVSRRAAVLIGLTTALFGAALFAVRDPAALVAVAVLWGIASGFQSAGGQSFMLAAVSRAQLGSATAAYFISSTASGALGAFLGGVLAERFGFSAVAGGAASFTLVALLLAARFLPQMGQDAQGAGARRSRWSGGYGDLLSRSDVRQLCALRFLPTVAWGAASLALPLLVFRHTGSAALTGLYGTVSLLGAAGAQLVTGRAVDALTKRAGRDGDGDGPRGPRPLVAPLAGAILVAATLCTLLAAFGAPDVQVPGLFIAGTLWTMAAWSLSTTMPPLIHSLGKGVDDGRLVALTHLLWSAGMLSGSFIAGGLLDLHPALPFAVASACLLLTLLIGLRFARGTS